MDNMRVLIYGASTNPDRYAFKALDLLVEKGYEVFLKGNKAGIACGLNIQVGTNDFDHIHTVTLYVGSQSQHDLIQDLAQIKPERIIFNPGTENPKLYDEIEKLNIKVEEACTLVLLHTKQF
jgi:predicted CoA-binding protein